MLFIVSIGILTLHVSPVTELNAIYEYYDYDESGEGHAIFH